MSPLSDRNSNLHFWFDPAAHPQSDGNSSTANAAAQSTDLSVSSCAHVIQSAISTSCLSLAEEAQAQQARAPKARSEASQELHSEDSSEYESESDPECSDPDASAADIIIIDADIITDVEAGTAPNPEDPEEVSTHVARWPPGSHPAGAHDSCQHR